MARGEKRPGPPKAPGGQRKEGEAGEQVKAVPKKAQKKVGAKPKAGSSKATAREVEKVAQAGGSVSDKPPRVVLLTSSPGCGL